jgi:hypothetical protein
VPVTNAEFQARVSLCIAVDKKSLHHEPHPSRRSRRITGNYRTELIRMLVSEGVYPEALAPVEAAASCSGLLL